jgi:hypothetical protein
VTDLELELELEKRFEAKADWSAYHMLAARVESFEAWRAAQDALSAIRRWAAPVLVTVFMTALNIGIALAHGKH